MRNDKPVSENLIPEKLPDGTWSPPSDAGGKRKYVEPTVSAPIDVLEATTFFQGGESSGTETVE